MGEKNRVKLSIAGCELVIVSDDADEYVRETGARVEDAMRRAMERGSGMSTTLAAVFAALEFCDSSVKERAAADNLRSQIKAYFDDASQAREEANRLRQQMESLKKQLGARERELAAQKAREEAAANELKTLKAQIGVRALEEQRKLHGNEP